MIKVMNLCAGYSKDKPVLENFSYTFEPKIYGILGSSGCGKTTLLRTIAGLLTPLSGSIVIDGNPMLRANQNNVYMMHQNYTSFDWRNCLDNILIAKEVKGNVSKEDIERAKELLNVVGLDGKETVYPRQLSGGQRQRLALARTLFMNPEIILMDEPLSALDKSTREVMQDLIIQKHKESNSTIIMVTHSREEAEKMCDVIIDI